MKKTIILNEADANELLSMLSELPIKYLNIVTQVQGWLNNKFKDDESASRNGNDGIQNWQVGSDSLQGEER